MKPRPALIISEILLVAASILAGWVVSIGQLIGDGWGGGGTQWLLAFSAVASAGAAVALRARLAGRHGWTAIGLLAAALSPTVFAYVLNVALVVLALIEVGLVLNGSQRWPVLFGRHKSA